MIEKRGVSSDEPEIAPPLQRRFDRPRRERNVERDRGAVASDDEGVARQAERRAQIAARRRQVAQ